MKKILISQIVAIVVIFVISGLVGADDAWTRFVGKTVEVKTSGGSHKGLISDWDKQGLDIILNYYPVTQTKWIPFTQLASVYFCDDPDWLVYHKIKDEDWHFHFLADKGLRWLSNGFYYGALDFLERAMAKNDPGQDWLTTELKRQGWNVIAGKMWRIREENFNESEYLVRTNYTTQKPKNKRSLRQKRVQIPKQEKIVGRKRDFPKDWYWPLKEKPKRSRGPKGWVYKDFKFFDLRSGRRVFGE